MTLEQILDLLKDNPEIAPNIAEWHTIDARAAQYADFPSTVDKRLIHTLNERGIERLYGHQAEAIDAIQRGEDVVVVTPTASGKTICYNLPVLDAILKDPEARALYLFPTKALSQDQLSELYELIQSCEADIKTYTFDGDTPQTARRLIRSAGHVVISNPDMLHAGILPHHTKWIKLLRISSMSSSTKCITIAGYSDRICQMSFEGCGESVSSMDRTRSLSAARRLSQTRKSLPNG